MSKDENFLQSLGISVKKQVAKQLQNKVNEEGLEGQVFVLTDDELQEEEDVDTLVSELIFYFKRLQKETRYASFSLTVPRGSTPWKMYDTNDKHIKVVFSSDSLVNLLRRVCDFIKNNRERCSSDSYDWQMKCGNCGYDVDTHSSEFYVAQWDKNNKEEEEL